MHCKLSYNNIRDSTQCYWLCMFILYTKLIPLHNTYYILLCSTISRYSTCVCYACILFHTSTTTTLPAPFTHSFISCWSSTRNINRASPPCYNSVLTYWLNLRRHTIQTILLKVIVWTYMYIYTLNLNHFV